MALEYARFRQAAVLTQEDLVQYERSDLLVHWLRDNVGKLDSFFHTKESELPPCVEFDDMYFRLSGFFVAMAEETGLPVRWWSWEDMTRGLPEHEVGERSSRWWEGFGRSDTASGAFLQEALAQEDPSQGEENSYAIYNMVMLAMLEAVFVVACRAGSAAGGEASSFLRPYIDWLGEVGDDALKGDDSSGNSFIR